MAERIVIEYEFKGYSPPDDEEAFYVDATITYSNANLHIIGGDTNLQAIREALGEDAFYLHGAHQLETHHRGRYCPRWREVWAVTQ